jgi:hypothetical protein
MSEAVGIMGLLGAFLGLKASMHVRRRRGESRMDA